MEINGALQKLKKNGSLPKKPFRSIGSHIKLATIGPCSACGACFRDNDDVIKKSINDSSFQKSNKFKRCVSGPCSACGAC